MAAVTAGSNEAIRLEAVSVSRDGLSILDRVTASIPTQAVTAIIGPNGAGKTTLLRAILGLIDHEGTISFPARRDLVVPTPTPAARATAPPAIGYVPQRLDFDRGMPIRVSDFLVMSLQRWPIWFGVRAPERDAALRNLRRVRAEHLYERPLGRLSGGELQRVLLALALQSDPEILLLDEPVAGVDVAGERQFCDLLEELREQSRLTLVMVSHDLSVVSRHASHVICLNRRVECAGPTPVVLTAANLKAIYGPHSGLYDHQGMGGHGHPHDCNSDHEHGIPRPAPPVERMPPWTP